MANVRARIKELIPTAKFANVEIDLELDGEKSEFVFDGDKDDLETALRNAYEVADKILQEKREPIIAELEAGNL